MRTPSLVSACPSPRTLVRTILLAAAAVGLGSALDLRDARAVSAPMVVDPIIQSWVNEVSVDSLFAYETQLVTYDRRNTASDTTAVNGIGAARNWLQATFRDISARNGGRLDGGWFEFESTVCTVPRTHRNVLATLPGTSTPERFFMVGGHMDSRTVGICDLTSLQAGANDDGSGVVAMLEMARILADEDLEQSVAFQCFTGEEQSLLGSAAYAGWARAHGVDIVAMLNNDIIGNVNGCPDSPSCGGGQPTDVDSTSVRAFAGDPATGLSRQLTRLAKRVGEAYVPSMTVHLQSTIDRPGRGSDHISFYNAGFPSMRFIETLEFTGQQHNGNDRIEFMEFPYFARNVKINLALLSNLAQAPATPANVRVFDSGTGGSIRVEWDPLSGVPDLAGYRVAYRFTQEPDSLDYADVVDAGSGTSLVISGLSNEVELAVSVGAYDTAGHESIFSEERLVTPGVAPHMPQRFTAWSKSDRVQLAWLTQELDLTRIRILRATSSLGPFTQIDSVAANVSTYQDLGLAANTYYYYRIQSLDATGLTSPLTAIDEGRRVSHQAGIYIVDATRNGAGGPGDPSDAQVDAFYESLLAGFPILDRYDWQTQHDTGGDQLTDADLSRFRTVVLHTDRQNSTIAADSTELRQFLDSGGQLWVGGWELRRSLGRAAFNPAGFKPASFMATKLKVDSLRTAAATEVDMNGANSLQSGYPTLNIDLAKWPFSGGNLGTQDGVVGGLLDPFSAVPLYSYRSTAIPPGPQNGRINGWKYPAVEPSVYVTDFPLYFFESTSARNLATIVMNEFGYGSTAVEPIFDHEIGYQLSWRPNPTPGNAELWFHLPTRGPVDLRIIDVQGREVRRLIGGAMIPSGWNHIAWDGHDGRGRDVASGVYYARFSAGGSTQHRSLTLLR
ncbi:MAG: M20/M25/M40 family metallo-hydrolase [Candidatus Eisenbacteria bacterium]|nr:M20/M25/M40 family metallo-hydrolase [Candidatus Eisenbacteria bacterium]